MAEVEGSQWGIGGPYPFIITDLQPYLDAQNAFVKELASMTEVECGNGGAAK